MPKPCGCQNCVSARERAVRRDWQPVVAPQVVMKTPDDWLRSYGIPVTAVPPDSYAAARPSVAPTDFGPDYSPFGQPPDGIQIALKRRREQK